MIKVISTLICITVCFYTEGVAQNSPPQQPTVHLVKPVTRGSVQNKTHAISSIKFNKIKIDFRTIKEDAIVEKEFYFTNKGDGDLIILGADASCGCTIPIIPKEPIKPNERSKIVVKYTAKNKVGPQKPLITVTTNGNPAVVHLHLEGWVDQIPGGVK